MPSRCKEKLWNSSKLGIPKRKISSSRYSRNVVFIQADLHQGTEVRRTHSNEHGSHGNRSGPALLMAETLTRVHPNQWWRHRITGERLTWHHKHRSRRNQSTDTNTCRRHTASLTTWLPTARYKGLWLFGFRGKWVTKLYIIIIAWFDVKVQGTDAQEKQKHKNYNEYD